jgi:cytochrome P450
MALHKRYGPLVRIGPKEVLISDPEAINFPAGSIVGVNAWVIHRNPTIFGPDANDFNLDRWLDADAAAHYG